MGDEAEDIYVQMKLEAYLNRPVELATLTYPEFFNGGRVVPLHSKKKAEKAAEEDQEYSIHTRGSDDFVDFMTAKQVRDSSQQQIHNRFCTSVTHLHTNVYKFVLYMCVSHV